MKNANTLTVFAVGLGMLLTASGASSATLITNGSFEIGPDPGTFGIDIPEGSTSIVGWTVGPFHIDYVAPGTWNASDGLRSIDLDGSVVSQPRNGSISQEFPTTSGQQYMVTFDLSGNPAGLPLLKPVEVRAGDSVRTFSFDIGAVQPLNRPFTINYEHESFIFTATSALTTLAFRSLTFEGADPGFGPVIDNVIVVEVPETSSWMVLACGLGIWSLLKCWRSRGQRGPSRSALHPSA